MMGLATPKFRYRIGLAIAIVAILAYIFWRTRDPALRFGIACCALFTGTLFVPIAVRRFVAWRGRRASAVKPKGKPDSKWQRLGQRLSGWLSALTSSTQLVIGGAVGVLIILFFLTFAFEYMRLKALGSPTVSFAPVTLKYQIDVETKVPPPVAEPEPNFISVFFANGKSDLGADQIEQIRTVADAVRACPGSKLSADGFASSRKYRLNSDAQNLKLIRDRLEAFFKATGFAASDPRVDLSRWETIEAMHKAAKFEDLQTDVKVKLALESLNRRVTVRLALASPCSMAMQVEAKK